MFSGTSSEWNRSLGRPAAAPNPTPFPPVEQFSAVRLRKETPAFSALQLWLWIGICLALWFPIRTEAQTDSGSIAGILVNSWDGKPIPGAIVTVRGTILAVTTDSQGRYRVDGVPAGDHTVRFSKSGFASVAVSGVKVAPGLVSNLDGSLRPEFYELEEYEVTAEQFQDQAI